MKSILQNEKDRTCYLCILLNGDYAIRSGLETHHAMPGTANRRLSERYGLKVLLCRQHHTDGPCSVHNNIQIQRLIQKKAQEAFERNYSHGDWMRVFGRDYSGLGKGGEDNDTNYMRQM